MDDETRRQIRELDEVRNAHHARLHILEVQAAQSGRATPPEIRIEIDTIRAQLIPIDAAIAKLTLLGTVRADVPGNSGRNENSELLIERLAEAQRREFAAMWSFLHDMKEDQERGANIRRWILALQVGVVIFLLLVAAGATIWLGS